jgi:hypothetical protein
MNQGNYHQQMPLYNQNNYMQQQFNAPYLGQTQMDPSFMFNQPDSSIPNMAAPLTALKLQELTGLPNLANPPAPSAPKETKQYDNLFSSDDESEKKAKVQQSKPRAKEDPRLDRKNREAKPVADDRQKISASLNLYRAPSEDTPKPARPEKEEQKQSPAKAAAPIAQSILNVWKQS